MLIAIGSLVFLWLSASAAWAAPAHHRRAKGRVCDQRGRVTLRTLARQTPVGPVTPPSSRVQAGLADSTDFVQRGHHVVFDDDLAAISNDAPAAQMGADVRLVPAFQSLGVVARPADPLPVNDAFSPRSPRGPPPSA